MRLTKKHVFYVILPSSVTRWREWCRSCIQYILGGWRLFSLLCVLFTLPVWWHSVSSNTFHRSTVIAHRTSCHHRYLFFTTGEKTVFTTSKCVWICVCVCVGVCVCVCVCVCVLFQSRAQLLRLILANTREAHRKRGQNVCYLLIVLLLFVSICLKLITLIN